MPTDTSETGLERLICIALTGDPCEPKTLAAKMPHETCRGAGRSRGSWRDCDREHCVDFRR